MHLHTRFSVVVLVLSVAQAGCGSSAPERTNLTGKVTIGAKPLVYGTIDFTPDSTKGHKGPAGTAEIVDGAYDTSAGGGGIFPGPHVVTVTGYEARPATANDETQPSTVKPLFSGYRVTADIPSSPYDLEIAGDAAGKDFNQPSGGAPRRGNDP